MAQLLICSHGQVMFMNTLQDLFWIIGIIVGLLTIFEKMGKNEKK